MYNETRVWVRRRETKGKPTYHLRWICPVEKCWKSRKVGTDRRRADREAAVLEKQLSEGTYKPVRHAAWSSFVDDHVEKLPGKHNAVAASQALSEFGDMCNPGEPRRVTYSMIEKYVARLRQKGQRTATINKKLRYLRTAFKRAIRRGYLVENPMDGWSWEREDKKIVRVVNAKEEQSLISAADKLYGLRWSTFIRTALNTGARRGELLKLAWDRVDFDAGTITLTETKGKADRVVPISPSSVGGLRRLQLLTLQTGGPFIGMGENISRKWSRIRKCAGVLDVTIHDLRRTFVTRLLQGGTRVDVVQKLAGHSSLSTTMKFYAHVSADDMRQAIMVLDSAAS